jgi:predicted transposase/invertase (TIGR01784 family)
MEIANDNSRFISILSDYGFKATFVNESNTLFLRKALQALINSDTPINEVKFDKNAFEALTTDSRSGIFDLSCTDENGNQFVVEMQLALGQPHQIRHFLVFQSILLHNLNN